MRSSNRRRQMRFHQLRRREFISLLGGAVAARSLAAHAQQPVIGFLSGTSPGRIAHFVTAFHEGLKDAGYVETQNVAIEYRWAQGQYNLLPTLALDLVNRNVAAIAAFGPAAALATKAATSTIPFVFTSGSDVVTSSLVASHNRPGGNATGVSLFTQAVTPKRLELLDKLVPAAATIAFLLNPNNPGAEGTTKAMQQAARALGRQLHVLNASTESEIDATFATLTQLRVGALVVANDPFFDDTPRLLLVALAARLAVPAIYGAREYAVEGGLMSYGTNLADAFRQVVFTQDGFSRAKSLPTFRSCSRPNLSLSSTSRPPRRSGSKYRRRCSRLPTR
jgi:putative ABC transport system substrate-binding protein